MGKVGPQFLPALLAAALLSACGGGRGGGAASSDPGRIESFPLASRAAVPAGGSLFQRMASTGIDFTNPLDPEHPDRRRFAGAMACGGIAVGDINNDGRLDLYFTSGPERNRLYIQTADWTFRDVTSEARVSGGDWSVGAAMIDIDNDGDLDLFICNHDAENTLYLNGGIKDGVPVFSDETSGYRLALYEASHTPAFCDYDRDGDLDLFVLTNRFYYDGDPAQIANPVEMVKKKAQVRPEYAKYIRVTRAGKDGSGRLVVNHEIGARPNYLYRNNGDGSFSEVTENAGIQGGGEGVSATWWDFDQDGWLDLYVANDGTAADQLYRNNGDGTFRDVIKERAPRIPLFARGADAGDLFGEDGLDLLVGDHAGSTHLKRMTGLDLEQPSYSALFAVLPPQRRGNALFLNGGDRFREVARLAGMAHTDWTWAVKIEDLDCDGHCDVVFSNGSPRNFHHPDFTGKDRKQNESLWDYHARVNSPVLREADRVFRNEGGLRFSETAADWGLAHTGLTYAVVHADLDGDGDLDQVSAGLGEAVRLYRNNATKNRVRIRLRGLHSHPSGNGARVRVDVSGSVKTRQVIPMRGFLGHHDSALCIGLGDAETLALSVDWPSGHRQRFENLAANQDYLVHEPAASPPEKTSPPSPPPAVRPVENLYVQHSEKPFNERRQQPLLPRELSRLGPGVAVGDIDGDGDDDFVVGGAKGFRTQLVRNDGKGRLRPLRESGLGGKEYEDLGLVLFDTDGDRDLDLYVVSGGNEAEAGHESFRDRLYLNDGKGAFAPAPAGMLPDLRDSGGPVCGADIDHDGDIDLFVGGRLVPGRYPTSPRSRLLIREDQGFSDATELRAPGLQDSGMVTAALFSDVDDDGWIDLLVAHDWGPIKLYRNREGRFTDDSKAAGLGAQLGWWNSLRGVDLEPDGDIDYLAGNLGLNSGYRASEKRPALLFHGVFDESGEAHILEGVLEGATLYPRRGRTALAGVFPGLKSKYPDHQSFAAASLQEMFTARLGEGLVLKANEFRHLALINDGSGVFTLNPLPRAEQGRAQRGPDLYAEQYLATPGAAGAGLLDLEGDGRPELVIGANGGPVQVFGGVPGDFDVLNLQALAPGHTLGARVTFIYADGSRAAAEVYGGGGYLSQSASRVFMPRKQAGKVRVRWPDGTEKEYGASELR